MKFCMIFLCYRCNFLTYCSFQSIGRSWSAIVDQFSDHHHLIMCHTNKRVGVMVRSLTPSQCFGSVLCFCNGFISCSSFCPFPIKCASCHHVFTFILPHKVPNEFWGYMSNFSKQFTSCICSLKNCLISYCPLIVSLHCLTTMDLIILKKNETICQF